MLEIKGRKLVRSEESPILTSKKVNDLVVKMTIALNPATISCLRKVVNLTESVFCQSWFFETFKGEAIRIANYNVFKKTSEFAKDYFNDKNQKYVLKITEVSQKEIILEIFLKEISILKIRFLPCAPIEFDFLTDYLSYEELFDYYQEKILQENNSTEEVQRMQSIIEIGHEAIKDIEGFFDKYIEDFFINLNQKYSWYVIKTHTFKDF